MTMTTEQLRFAHPRLVYRTCGISTYAGSVVFTYEFLLEPDIIFRPTVSIPFQGTPDVQKLYPYAFHVGMVEAISYWKAACPREFVIEAGMLSPMQIRFWNDLFIHGLGEFFYRNQIDFTVPDFFGIRCVESVVKPGAIRDVTDLSPRVLELPVHRDLILVGGGKDSALTLGMIKKGNRTFQTMVLNPTAAALRNIECAGYDRPIVVTRVIDPALLELNRLGYLNGHTHFSAYLAFLGSAVAALYGYESVIVSNERSANEGNVMYHGMEINHQYSKSFRFEQLFRQYMSDFFDDAPDYFSLLRPLNDLQISRMFADYPQFFRSFRSCNVGSVTDTWCGTCAKCAFTYLMLCPYVSHDRMMEIFGHDLLNDTGIIGHIRAIAGLSPVKPFECVGTRDETRLGVLLSVDAYARAGKEIPEGLLKIKGDLMLTHEEQVELSRAVIDDWGDTYNVPDGYLSLLRSSWDRVHMENTYEKQ